MHKKTSPTTITTNDQMTYYIMSEHEALGEINKTTKELNEILSLPSITLVRLILNHFHWDKDFVTERFFDDPNSLFSAMNVASPYLSPSVQWNPLSPGNAHIPDLQLSFMNSADNSDNKCRTCYQEKPSNEIIALRCRHQHCLTCWRSYLESSIVNHGSQKPIYCPSRCIQIVDDEQILKIMCENKALCDRYQQCLVKTFVESNRLTQWCPGVGCSAIIKMRAYAQNNTHMIECDRCKMVFCFRCSEAWHEPVQCSLLKAWENKNQSESMNATWIIANTKCCPKCQSNIEKNGGCNHMTCRKAGCGYEFCWLCLGDWKAHSNQQCNVFRQKEIDNEQMSAQQILERYLHYYSRYREHEQSLTLEKKLSEKVEQIIKDMEAKSMKYNDRQAVQKAFEVLQRCRRTLKYTYAFAFYLRRNNQSEIFEQNQADLERSIETLSGYLENEINPEQDSIIPMMNKMYYCDQRATLLLDHCKHGYSQHYWEGLDPY